MQILFSTGSTTSIGFDTEQVGLPRKGDLIDWRIQTRSDSPPSGRYRVDEVVWQVDTWTRIVVFMTPVP